MKLVYIVTMNFQMLRIISNDRICRPTRWRHCYNNVVFEGYPLSQQSLSYRHDVLSPHRTDWIHSILVKSATTTTWSLLDVQTNRCSVMNYTAYLECCIRENDVADMDVMHTVDSWHSRQTTFDCASDVRSRRRRVGRQTWRHASQSSTQPHTDQHKTVTNFLSR